MKIKFCGASMDVTGSCHMISTDSHKILLDCGQFPMLAVWANPKGPFICLEPWFGRTDDEGFTGAIDQKKGIEFLEPGEVKEIAYSMVFY